MTNEARLRKPNMHDVAQRAGVSQRTVSNVVRGYRHVSPKTRDRVLQAIDEIGYKPNVMAQRLREGRTGMIALAIPDLTWPYFSGLAQTISRAAAEQDLTTIVIETAGTAEGEQQVLSGLHKGAFDGLIVSPIGIDSEDLRQLHLELPIVLLGEQIRHAGLLHPAVDNIAAAEDVVEHLVECGAETFWFLGSSETPQTRSAGPLRLQGFRSALEAHGLPLSNSKQVVAPIWTMSEGYSGTKLALESSPHPDAIVAMNDLLALGALRACAEAGISVPAEMLLTGWDDIPFTQMSTPSITSVSADVQAIGDIAVDGIVRMLADPDIEMEDVVVAHELIVRESSTRNT